MLRVYEGTDHRADLDCPRNQEADVVRPLDDVDMDVWYSEMHLVKVRAFGGSWRDWEVQDTLKHSLVQVQALGHRSCHGSN